MLNPIKIALLALPVALMSLATALPDQTGRALPVTKAVLRNCPFAMNLAPQPKAATPAGSVLWSAGMETGDLSEWFLPPVSNPNYAGGGIFNSSIATTCVDVIAHTGSYSAKLSINTAIPPQSQTSGARLFRWLEPQTYSDLYYTVWYYFPQRYSVNGSPSWWNVLAWKSHIPGGADSPFFILSVGNLSTTDGTTGPMYLYLYNQNTQTAYTQTPPPGLSPKFIPEAQWFRLDAFYRCAADNTGHVTIWQDGQLMFDVPNVPMGTRYPNGDCQWSINNYSNSLSPSTATIYVDDAAICTGGFCP
jgi:hypothetical protein